MWGAFIGLIISLIVILTSGDVSWWWLLWGSLIGFVVEVVIRLGCGAEFGDACYAAVDLSSAFDGIGGDGGGGGDCGGGDGGGDGGGGDGGGD